MAKVWVLDTETKGTGAEMVPLERVHDDSAPLRPSMVREKPPRPHAAPPDPGPREFRVVDVLSRRLMADGVDGPAAAEALRDTRSVVDVAVYARRAQQGGSWRLLTMREKKLLWSAAQR